MTCPDEILLTKELLSFNTINPPGNEMEVAQFVGKLLLENGASVSNDRAYRHRLRIKMSVINRFDIMELILREGVSGEDPDQLGELLYPLLYEDLDVCRPLVTFLVGQGANVNFRPLKNIFSSSFIT